MKQKNNKNMLAFLVLAILSVFVAGCTDTGGMNNTGNGPKACTMDAKICADGSAVGRDGDNNCEFFPCPDPNETEMLCTADAKMCPDGSYVGRDPENGCAFYECSAGDNVDDKYRQYAAHDITTCAATTFLCSNGTQPFFGEEGCGCEAIEPVKYVSHDLDECSRIRYMCEENYVPFSDNEGCGCEWKFPEEKDEGKLQAHECTVRSDACTKEYMPVCGWNDETIQCIAYPCAQTYGNKCEACSNEHVAYYTEGECPSPGDDAQY